MFPFSSTFNESIKIPSETYKREETLLYSRVAVQRLNTDLGINVWVKVFPYFIKKIFCCVKRETDLNILGKVWIKFITVENFQSEERKYPKK